mmetsp:Transcript_14553/g.15746  ORF Transcript_14553/g.15746 Transcript_14553/m.15746 type:complete len:318 (-) Transcript_14553:24-977(-)|eukprot:CAMPEP_0173149076 /NCGR_PEP_ID=MMETSP1105-20130129/10109_1 /TAXON_ID=2985 /ORGANISM="Ochromonas sp., Strain BG-1" /LENGTH=317 /DNA_ID=CAMNT_0014063871 /DNA_START=113 /DNA_END=1066 /DNA_ORIENTATION=+
MSSEKYERPTSFPLWVDSVEDEGLVVEALALDASLDRNLVFSSKRNCERFINTKRSLSVARTESHTSILVDALKSNTKVMSAVAGKLGKIGEVLEEIGDKDAYDRISESSKPRELTKDDYASLYGVPKKDLKCMVTGMSFPNWNLAHGNHPITCAHLLPRNAEAKERLALGYGKADIENIRNSVLLCKGIEEAFDHKFISFVPCDRPFSSNRYELRIWIDAVRNNPIYEGSVETIGQYDKFPLTLTVGTHSHDPFKRALSYQAYRSFKTWSKELGLKELPEDSDLSVYTGTYQKQRADYAKQLAKDIEADAEDEDDS